MLTLDPALPDRDAVLDRPGWELVRAKYRIGESLRVVHRTLIDGRIVVESARVRPGGGIRWSRFPHDRRLTGLADVLAPAGEVAALVPGWATSEVAEYAPERSLTVRALDRSGRAVAYVKAFAPGTVDVVALAARYDAVAAGLAATGLPVRSPRAVARSTERHLLAVEAMPGERLADRPDAAHRLGRAIAAVHGLAPVPGLEPFCRLSPERLATSARLVARARPDVAVTVRAVVDGLLAEPPPAEPAVVLHGDCHPKNAIVGDGTLALIDLDQAGTGPAAADLGSFLARARVAATLGDPLPVDAFLAAYATVRPLPSDESLRWHAAAALVAEQAVRAVNRVRPLVLARLPEVLEAAVP